MNPRIEEWLQFVWKERKYILNKAPRGRRGQRHFGLDRDNPAVRFIAGYIDDRGNGRKTVSNAQVAECIDDVLKVASAWTLMFDFYYTDRQTGQETSLMFARDADIRRKHIDELRSSEFQFRLQPMAGRERLFINAKEESRHKVFRRLVYLIKDLGDADVCAITLIAPGRKGTKSIVIHTRTKQSQQAVIQHLRLFARSHPELFSGTVPALTARVPGVMGFSTATTPPDIQVTDRGVGLQREDGPKQDFITFRAQLVFAALDKSDTHSWFNNQKHYQEFKARVTRNFQAAGLDVNNPSTQDKPRDLNFDYTIERLQEWADYDNAGTIHANLGMGGLGPIAGPGGAPGGVIHIGQKPGHPRRGALY